jgi:cytochrome c oxidase assembly protein subunit 15
VAGVVFQGVLGGLRVWGNELFLAKIHGCTGPLFFALTAALVTLTSDRWRESGPRQADPAARTLARWTMILAAALYLEIVFGAQLRHVSLLGETGWFAVWVWIKLIMAGLIAVGVGWLWLYAVRRVGARPMIVRRVKVLAGLFLLQLLLGAGTWVTNYGWPLWFRDLVWPLVYTVVAEGGLQVLTTTVHAAIGALNLVAAASLALWSRRLLIGAPR